MVYSKHFQLLLIQLDGYFEGDLLFEVVSDPQNIFLPQTITLPNTVIVKKVFEFHDIDITGLKMIYKYGKPQMAPISQPSVNTLIKFAAFRYRVAFYKK